MKRFLPIHQEFLVGDKEVVIELSPENVWQLALEIVLLLNSMTNELTLSSSSDQRVEITILEDRKNVTAQKQVGARIQFELPRNEAEYLQSVLLRAYRDGMAAVEHVHIECKTATGEMDLTFFFQNYKPPLSGAELADALGDR